MLDQEHNYDITTVPSGSLFVLTYLFRSFSLFESV